MLMAQKPFMDFGIEIYTVGMCEWDNARMRILFTKQSP